VYGALSKEKDECLDVQVPSSHFPILKEKCMKPSYMAIKKALYGRQPSSFYFFGFVFVALEREYFLFVFSFCVLVFIKKVCFSMSTIA
jgi:hypothetical protein